MKTLLEDAIDALREAKTWVFRAVEAGMMHDPAYDPKTHPTYKKFAALLARYESSKGQEGDWAKWLRWFAQTVVEDDDELSRGSAKNYATRLRSIADQLDRLTALEAENARLRLSKQKTHAFLTELGIDECQDAEGCRAEARAALLRTRIDTLETENANWRELYESDDMGLEDAPDLEAENERLKQDTDYWQRMFIRARCGCLALDCLTHGAYVPEEVDRARAALQEPAQ